MSRLDRLDRLESRFPGPRELNVGGGRRILTTLSDRLDMFASVVGDGDHPMLDAVRAGEGEPDCDGFVEILRALGHDYKTREEYEAAVGIEVDDEEDPRVEIPPEIEAEIPKPLPSDEEWAASRWEKWKAERGIDHD